MIPDRNVPSKLCRTGGPNSKLIEISIDLNDLFCIVFWNLTYTDWGALCK